MISALSVQVVLNFGRRIAAAISSGSCIIPPKRFWTPSWTALIRGRHILEDVSSLLSFACNWKTTGRSHPMCVLVSDWRMFKAFTTGFITVQYSVRKTISAGLNLYSIKKKHVTFNKFPAGIGVECVAKYGNVFWQFYTSMKKERNKQSNFNHCFSFVSNLRNNIFF